MAKGGKAGSQSRQFQFPCTFKGNSPLQNMKATSQQ